MNFKEANRSGEGFKWITLEHSLESGLWESLWRSETCFKRTRLQIPTFYLWVKQEEGTASTE